MKINWTARGYTEEQFIAAWLGSKSIAIVLQKLHKKPAGGNYKTAKRTAIILGLPDDHMTGQGWNAGSEYRHFGVKYSLEEILIENSTYSSTYSLKLRLIKENIFEDKCSRCGITEWLGSTLPTALDHINGINTDNRIENLRILCLNCHGQTDTFAGRNKGTYAPLVQLAGDN